MINIPFATERLVIRRFEKTDLPLFLNFMLDSESTTYLMFEDEQKTEDGAKALFNYVCDAYDSNQPVHSYAIADKSTNRYLGSCGYANYDDGIAECYYSVNKSEVGKGIATEAISALAKTLSNSMEVRAYCHPKNYAAHQVAKKAGFISKGIQIHKNFGNTGELFVYDRSS